MRTIKHLADVAGQRVFADFGSFVLDVWSGQPSGGQACVDLRVVSSG
jgi:hypothetical protein